MTPRPLRHPHAVGPVLLRVVLLAAVVALAWPALPGVPGRAPLLGQALVQGAAAAVCWRLARTAPRPGRVAWGLLAAGQAVWCLTDLAYAATRAAGADVAAVSAFDVPWLLYYLATLGAVALLYGAVRPEPGWLGGLDALVLTGAASLACWVWVLQPIADGSDAGTLGVAVNALYPALDLLGLCIVAWLAVRRRATPRWIVELTAFFGVGAAAGVVYMQAVLTGSAVAEGLSDVLYAAASIMLLLAARRRLRGGERARAEHARATTPPVWSVLLPFVPVLAVAAILVDGRTGLADRLAVGLVLVVVARLCWSLIVLGRLGHRHERLMLTDPLTGAHNRLFLAEELGRLTARARRDGAELAAVSLDLDGFKAVNDTLGHAVGDALLTRMTAEAAARLREGDVLCRIGGDEFLVLLPGTGEHGAVALAARLLDGLEDARAAVCPAAPVRGSIGVAVTRGDAVGGEELLRRADEAMYAGKRAGGGRVVAWRPGLDLDDAEPGVLYVSGG